MVLLQRNPPTHRAAWPRGRMLRAKKRALLITAWCFWSQQATFKRERAAMLTFQAGESISGARRAASCQAPSSAEPAHHMLQPATCGHALHVALVSDLLSPAPHS